MQGKNDALYNLMLNFSPPIYSKESIKKLQDINGEEGNLIIKN